MYDLVIDVDGVLLDIHEQLKTQLAALGYTYDVNNVLTYDFNKSLPEKEAFTKLPPRNVIFSLFELPSLYEKAPVDTKSIELIQELANKGLNILLHTLSPNEKVGSVKFKLYKHWFDNYPSVSFSNIVNAIENGKGGIDTKAVIEDCHINLRDYGKQVAKYLIDKPYNREMYNQDYTDVFYDPKFKRCCDTYTAIKTAGFDLLMQ